MINGYDAVKLGSPGTVSYGLPADCVTMNPGGGVVAVGMGLSLPAGATITGVRISYVDSTTTGYLAAQLHRVIGVVDVEPRSGAATTPEADTGTGTLTLPLDPVLEPVSESSRYLVYLWTFVTTQVCSVAVDYTMPTT